MNLGFVALMLISPCVIGEPEQCRNYRTIQNEPWRSIAVPSPDGSYQHCDTGLRTGWYRILPIAGTDGKSDLIWRSPEIGTYKCGARHPAYLNADADPLPKILYQTVHVGLCFALGAGFLQCIPSNYQIEITNCGDFNVYKLHALRGFNCPIAYCTSETVPCPAGKFSTNGFEPDCTDKVPIYTGIPVVEHSVDVVKSEVVFVCNLDNVESQNNFEHTRRIRWYMTRADDLTGRPTLVHEEKGSAAEVNRQLKESDWRNKFSLGVNIACEIKGFTNNDVPGSATTSESFFAGLKVTSNLTTIRGNEQVQVKIISTVPVLCPQQFISGNTCTESLRVSVITRDLLSTTCSKGDFKPSVVVPTSCGTEFTPALPQQIPADQNTFLKVQGRQPDIFNGNAALSLILSVREQTGFEVWKQKLPDVRVAVLNENAKAANKICRSNNDPHMTTFANRNYELQETGTFILYKHETLPLQVQAAYQQCHPPFTSAFCNCGIAVQSGRDVFVYDTCDKKLYNRVVQFLRVGVLGCNNKAMVIEKQPDNSYSIILPTGTKIFVSAPYKTRNGKTVINNIRLTASTSDFGFNTIGGVCGVIVPENGEDLKPKDGLTAINDTREFYRSWKVNKKEENLFLNASFVDNDDYTLPSQCECKTDTEEVVCKPTVAGTRCEIKDDETLLRVCKQGKRRKREILEQADLDIFADQFTFPEQDFDDTPPNTFKDGWTEETAIQFCNRYLADNAPDECLALNNLNIDFLKNGCVLDIKSVGNTDFALGNLASLLRDCVIETVGNNTVVVEVDPSEPERSITNNSTTSTITTTMRPISAQAEQLLKRICPGACRMRGSCVEGQCRCNDGFSGVDCSVDLNIAPSNLLLLNNGVCDLQSRSCRSTIVFGEDISTVRDVSCVIKEYVFEDDNGHQNKKTNSANYTVPATVMSAGQVKCTLRRTVLRSPVYFYEIALTNGGNVSESEQMIIFDSSCYSTTEDKQPVLKDDACVIDSTCRVKHDLNPENNQEFCKPEESQFTWTVQPPPSNLRLPNNGVCDILNSSCLAPVVSAQDISTLTEVSCVIKEYVVTEDNNGYQNRTTKIAEYTVQATAVSAGQARCTLQRTVPGRLVYAYDISLTNGGNKSESEEMIVFDPTCYSVTEEKRTVLKDDVCVIDSTCRAKYDFNPENHQEFCKPEESQFTWTVQPPPSNLRLPNNGVCDILSSSCLAPVVFAHDISSLTNVSCVVEEYVFEFNNGHQNRKTKTAEYAVPAIVMSADQVRCTLRRTVPARLVYLYNISLTNGGDNSESKEMILFNPTCFSMTEEKQPVLKVDVCIIDSTCHSKNILNLENDQEFCKPEESQFAWTVQPTPSNLRLPNNGVCDIQNGSCLSPVISAQNISALTNVSCVVEEYVFENNNGHQNRKTKITEYTVPASAVSADQVRCTLRRTVPGRLVYAYDISLTNGGNISESEQMIVFESNCYSTTEEKQPVLKDDVCVINSTCRVKYDFNPQNDQEFCKPEDDQFTWTVQPAPSNLRLPNNGVCDILNSSCLTLVVSAQDISSLTNVSCVVEEYVFEDNNGHQNTKVKVAEYTVPATSVLADQVRCTLRRTVPGRLVYAYDIALTNGGDKSELETFIILETNCYSTTEDNQPNLKDNVCVINSTCFTDGALNPDNNQELCKPSDNQFSWSPAITHILQCFNLPAAQQYDCVLRFVRNGD